MKQTKSSAHTLAAILAVTMGLLVEDTQAALTLTINEATPNRLSLTVSGFFDANVVGNQKNWLAIKGDWSNNDGTNVDWIADSVGWGDFSDRPGVTIEEDTIAFSGLGITQRLIAADARPWGDSVYYSVFGGVIPAGTSVSGTITLAGAGLFDFSSIESLQLVSGFDDTQVDFERLEGTTAVPEPTTSILVGCGIFGLCFRRSRNA